MKDLRTIREVGEAMNQAELLLPCDETIAQSVKIFAMLYAAAKNHLAETAELFRPERVAELIEMQNRLSQLDRSKARYGANRELTQTAGAGAATA